MDDRADVIVVGSGPNGLAAACALARSGWDVTVLEQAAEPGGAVRCGELTLPGYVHDLCSSFYGLLHASPAFGEFELGRRVEWAHFETPVAAAVEPGVAALCHADLEWTVDHLNGILFIDYISKLKRDRVVKKFTKAQKLARSGA